MAKRHSQSKLLLTEGIYRTHHKKDPCFQPACSLVQAEKKVENYLVVLYCFSEPLVGFEPFPVFQGVRCALCTSFFAFYTQAIFTTNEAVIVSFM